MLTVTIVIPAYRAETTLRGVVEAINHLKQHATCYRIEHILVVDDASPDGTVAVAQQLKHEGLIDALVLHPKNLGYGGNQKTCYQWALEHTQSDVVAMIHGDGQYWPDSLPALLDAFSNPPAGAVFGSRLINGQPVASGMPIWKYWGNILTTTWVNVLTGQYLSELHCGLRVYSRAFLETVPFQTLSNNFVFDTQIILQAYRHQQRIIEVPIETRYFEAATQISFWRCVPYTWQIIQAAMAYAGRV